MALHPKIQILSKYLDDPQRNQIPNVCQDPISMYFLSFMGDLFLKGYRIFQKVGDQTIILSLMEYQSYLSPSSTKTLQSHPQYKIVHFLLQIDLLDKQNKRVQIFKDLKQIAENIDGTKQINLIYLKNQKFSVMNVPQLQSTRRPDSCSFYKIPDLTPQKKGYKHIDVMEQGTRLHALIQFLSKGNAKIQNMQAFKRGVIGDNSQIKFSYQLQKVQNTIRFIIGRQVIENDYLIMSSQKWMRKKTQKIYKRFDLILRNEDKICIIDWKFSKVKAVEKINTRAFLKKNKLYLQLAKKDYRSDVELKFYCIHVEDNFSSFHKFTQANWHQKISEITIDQIQEEDSEIDDDEVVFYDQDEINQLVKQTEIKNGFIQPPQEKQTKNPRVEEFKRNHGILEQVVNSNHQSKQKEKLKTQKNSGHLLNRNPQNQMFVTTTNFQIQEERKYENASFQDQSFKKQKSSIKRPSSLSDQKDKRRIRKLCKPNQIRIVLDVLDDSDDDDLMQIQNPMHQNKVKKISQIWKDQKKFQPEQKEKQQKAALDVSSQRIFAEQMNINTMVPQINETFHTEAPLNKPKEVQIISQLSAPDYLDNQQDPSFELLQKQILEMQNRKNALIPQMQKLPNFVKDNTNSQSLKTRLNNMTKSFNDNQKNQADKENPVYKYKNADLLQIIEVSSTDMCTKQKCMDRRQKPLLFDPRQIQPNKEPKHLLLIGSANNSLSFDAQMFDEKDKSNEYQKIHFDIQQTPQMPEKTVEISKALLQEDFLVKNGQKNKQRQLPPINENFQNQQCQIAESAITEQRKINIQNIDVNMPSYKMLSYSMPSYNTGHFSKAGLDQRQSGVISSDLDDLNRQEILRQPNLKKKIRISSEKRKVNPKAHKSYIVILSSSDQNQVKSDNPCDKLDAFNRVS